MTGPAPGIVELQAPPAVVHMPPRKRAARRRLLALVVALLALIAAAAAAVVVSLSESGPAPPAEGAAAVVPADALAYVHVSTDRTRPQVRRALALLTRFPDYPTLSAGVLTRIAAIAGGSASTDYYTAIRPWLGKEAALAFLNTPSASAASLLVLDVARPRLAQRFVTGHGAVPAGTYRGVELQRYPGGTELAFVRHYLVVGGDAGVRTAIDAGARAAPSLAQDPGYRRASGGAPAARVLDVFASAAGVQRLLGAQRGLGAALVALLYRPSLQAVSFALSPASGGAHLWIHSVLDPALARLGGSPPPGLSPKLLGSIPAGSPLVLDLAGLVRSGPRFLQAIASLGIATQLGPLLQRLGAALGAEGVNVHQILSLFGGESAVALVPTGGAPSLVIVARTSDPARAAELLGGVEAPLESLFPAPAAGPGQAPLTSERQLGDVTVHQVSLGTGLQLDYAVSGALVIVSTSVDGIAAVAANRHPIVNEPEFRATAGSRPDRVGSLLFLDSSQLLSLGEQTGIAGGARFRALQRDLLRIRAISLSSTSGEDDSTAEMNLQIP